MKNILDSLNSNNGLKAGLGSVGDTLKSTLQNMGAGNGGGIGGLLGSAALGGLLGALFTGKRQKNRPGRVDDRRHGRSPERWPGISTKNGPRARNQAAQPRFPRRKPPLPLRRKQPCFCWRPWSLRHEPTGTLTDTEKARIQSTAASLFPGQSVPQLLEALMNAPIDPGDLAARVRDPEEGRDLYRLSCAVVDVDNFMERSYLDGLAQPGHQR